MFAPTSYAKHFLELVFSTYIVNQVFPKIDRSDNVVRNVLVEHPAGRSINSYRIVNSFIMVLFENFLRSVKIFA